MLRNRRSLLGSITEVEENRMDLSHRRRSRTLPPLQDTGWGSRTPSGASGRGDGTPLQGPRAPRSCNASRSESRVASTGGYSTERRGSGPQIVARRLPKRYSFGHAEADDHYVVDLDASPTVCRRRAASVTDPHLMTDDERRLLAFLESTAGRPRGSSRIYTDQSLVIDPKLSVTDFHYETIPNRRNSRLPSIPHFPPIYLQPSRELEKRSFSPRQGVGAVPEEIDEETWEELQDCRYLRPKALRFRQLYEEEEREREADDVFTVK